MIFSKKIAELTESLATITTDRDRLSGLVAELQSANDLFKTADTDQLEQIRVLTGERDTLLTEKADLTQKLADMEATIETRVREAMAAPGVPVVSRVVDKPEPGSPKAENPQGLTPKQRLAASFNAALTK